jgi:aminoglycoside phosphotransferase (APT) family kinase protein
MNDTLPSKDAVVALLKEIEPGSTFVDIHPVGGDHYNAAYILEARTAAGVLIRMVIKCYAEIGSDLTIKARREFTALTWLQSNRVSAPRPLYLDERGAFFGSPAIVTDFIAGEQVWQPSDYPADPQQWMHEMATVLAHIHRTPCDPEARVFLRNGAATVLWFLGDGVMPERMKNHPAGEAVWKTVVEHLPNLKPVEPALTHIDYWRGNLLWNQSRLTAVIDWEEASLGDPAQDVAYCRMDLWASVSEELADEFLRSYEQTTGRPLANLGFWELVAAARPIWRPEGWFVTPGEKDRFRQFVANAIRRVETIS